MRIAGLFLQDINIDARLDPDPEEPLGIEYVLASAVEHGYQIRLFTPLDSSIDDLSKLIVDFNPEVLAISVYTPHVPSTLSVASEVRKKCPEVVVIVGGPHPTADPSIVYNPQIDFVVIGEGEDTFCELLSALEQGVDPVTVNGIAFAQEGKVVLTTPRKRITNLDYLPYPLYERRYYSYRCRSVLYPPAHQVAYSPMLFSRGCSMPCRFCSSRELWGGEVYSRTPENMLAEVKHLQDIFGVNFVFFEDLTFTIKRKLFLQLCKLLEESNLGIYWGCETHVNAVTPTDIATMSNAGCTKIIWGVENLNENTLRRIRKKQTLSDISRSLSASAYQGILNWGCYIIGFPWEREEDILHAAANLDSLDIHQLRVSIATPFPGSQWHKEMPKSQLYPDLSLYDTNHLVYEHPTISPERMKELQNEVFIRFYRSKKYRDKVAKMVKKFPHLRESFDEFLAYIDTNVDKLRSGQKEITETYTLRDISQERICV